jgi:hypothetical protein
MWALKNKTPYAAERTWTRDKAGAYVWIVGVKATFGVGAGGKLTLLDEQPPLLLAPEYAGEPGRSSLKYEAELGPPRPTTDLVVRGEAHAPGGRPAPTVPVRLRVGELEKTIVVHGDRVYQSERSGLTTSRPRPFVARPIVYEDAFGGSDLAQPDPRRQRMDLRNPVGKGVAVDPRRLHGQPAHAIEYPQADPASRGPAGFGPLASYWSPRRELAGTYDQKWETARKPFLPDDYDERWLLCAPADQRPPRHLTGGERVQLLNLTAEGKLEFELPKIFLTFASRFGSVRQEHRSRLAAVVIEPEVPAVKLVWLTSLVVPPTRVDDLDETVVDEKPFMT